ncbi:retrovirus-related pol polyprotein from transposon TNT 1-94 [Tanacetum coccineum]
MLFYLAGMEPYYLKCIKDGPFQLKTAEGDDKPESQWTPDERRVGVQDQHLISIIMSCLLDDIMESVISCETAKATWTDLVHNFEGPSDTKENRIMDLKLMYQTFRAKPTKSLSHTYNRYKTLLNELANDGVNLSKHEINVGFMNSLLEKWLTFSQGPRNANHTQTLDLADIYGRVVYKDNLIQRRYSDTKKALITTPSSTAISTAFFSNNVIQDFQENSDDEVDESKKANENTEYYKCGKKGHFAKDCFSKTSKPSYKSPVSGYSSVSKGFQPKFTPKLIQSSQNSISQANPKIQKYYKAEYKKMKSKLALLEANPSTSQTSKTFQPKNKCLVTETFDWDEKEVSDDEEVTQVKVLMALADDELTVGKNHARNDEWIDITMRKINILLSMDEDADWQNYIKYINIDLKFVKEQRLNLLSKYNKIVFELNKCRDEILVLKQAKLDDVTFQIQTLNLLRSFTKLRGNAIDLPTLLSKREIRLREPIWYLDSGCSRSMTGVKSYLHKYVEQLVAFVNGLKYNLISISQLCDAKYIVQFDDKKGTIFNANKEIVLITPIRNDVYALDMSSLTPNRACFFAKASENVNWLWHKRLSHLNFKNINKLAKQNKVLGLPSLVIQRINLAQHVKKGITIEPHSKLNKIALSGSVCIFFIWICLDQMKSQAPKMIMSFIGMVENQNDVKVKQIRTNNGTEFRNHELERARTMLNGSVISKHLWTEAVRIAYYTQNKSIIVKRHDKTPYEIFKERIPDISYFHVFGCPVFIHNHKDHLGRFDAKDDDGPSGNNTEVSVSISESLVPHVPQPHIFNQASTSSHPVPQDSWSKDQHIELVNIIGDPGEGMLTRSMTTKLIAASASKCLFADFLSKIEPKKVSEALKHPRWVDAMQEELNKFYKNKVWTPVLLLYGKITIDSKWVFKNKKDEPGITTKNKAKLVAQGYSQEDGIDYDETFAPVARRKPSGYYLLLLHT